MRLDELITVGLTKQISRPNPTVRTHTHLSSNTTLNGVGFKISNNIKYLHRAQGMKQYNQTRSKIESETVAEETMRIQAYWIHVQFTAIKYIYV